MLIFEGAATFNSGPFCPVEERYDHPTAAHAVQAGRAKTRGRRRFLPATGWGESKSRQHVQLMAHHLGLCACWRCIRGGLPASAACAGAGCLRVRNRLLPRSRRRPLGQPAASRSIPTHLRMGHETKDKNKRKCAGADKQQQLFFLPSPSSYTSAYLSALGLGGVNRLSLHMDRRGHDGPPRAGAERRPTHRSATGSTQLARSRVSASRGA